MIVDACLFAGEREMLELRFRTLAHVVDRFVVVACTLTHQGQPIDQTPIVDAFRTAYTHADGAWPISASLHWVSPSRILERHGRMFERAPSDRGEAQTRWFQHIEKQHRDGVLDAVRSLVDDPFAVVMVSDVDEIPNTAVVTRFQAWPYARAEDWLVLHQRFHSGALDVLHPQQPWPGTCASLLMRCEPQAHRDARTTIGTPAQSVIEVPLGGWHLSWFGTDAERARKLETFSHAELRHTRFDPAEARRTLRHADGQPLRQLSLEETYAMDWPLPLLDGSFEPPAWWFAEGSRV